MDLLQHLAATTSYSKVAPALEPQTFTSSNDTAKVYDRHGHEVREFFTDYGTQRVFIDGKLESGRPVIMTYHDIGVNHTTCYSSFFNMMRQYNNMWQYFTLVHIDAPQHHAMTVHEQDQLQQQDSNKQTNQVDAFDMLELSCQIEEIRNKLQIERFVAFGIGAACTVWTHYAINYSRHLRGVVMINGVGSEAGWREWLFDVLASKMGHDSQFVRDTMTNSLMKRHFPTGASSETYEFFDDELAKMSKDAIIKYARGFGRRMTFTESQLRKIKTNMLVICGEFSRCREETIMFQKILPKRYTTFVMMNNIGFLLTESNPQKLCSPVNLFVESLGFTLISMKNRYGPLETQELEQQQQQPKEIGL